MKLNIQFNPEYSVLTIQHEINRKLSTFPIFCHVKTN